MFTIEDIRKFYDFLCENFEIWRQVRRGRPTAQILRFGAVDVLLRNVKFCYKIYLKQTIRLEMVNLT